VEGVALGDEDLGADEVEAGDDLGDGVFDLDARVHLDEEPLVPVEIVEELDGAGVVVADLAGHAGGGVAELARTGCRAGRSDGATSTTFWWRRWTEQSRSWRWMTLPCWSPRIWTSMCLARGMYFRGRRRDCRRRGRPRPAPRRAGWREVGGLVHDAHAAAAAAEGGLDDEREADGLGVLRASSRSVTGFSVPGGWAR
jgi:hypothetical protein